MDEQAKQEVERKRYREFTVTPGVCGFKVKIGCSEAYFGTTAALGDAITDYLADPITKERRLLNSDIRFGGPLAGAPTPLRDCHDMPQTCVGSNEIRRARYL